VVGDVGFPFDSGQKEPPLARIVGHAGHARAAGRARQLNAQPNAVCGLVGRVVIESERRPIHAHWHTASISLIVDSADPLSPKSSTPTITARPLSHDSPIPDGQRPAVA
jgi:hypothetical protein